MYNVTDWLARRAQLSPASVALIEAQTGLKITYREWNTQANRTAHFLQDTLDLRKGDRLAVLANNNLAYLDLWFALGKIGGVLQNLNWRLATPELATLLRDAAPRALVYDLEFEKVVAELRRAFGDAITFMGMNGVEDSRDLDLSMRNNSPATNPQRPEISPEDPWVICYTGGTTGLPKGALLSHRSITANAINTITSWGLSPDDVTILNAPLFHTGGLNVFTAPLVYLGGTSIVCRQFEIEQTFDLLESGRVTIWFGVPTMFVMMQNHERWASADFSGLRFIISGGAPCPMPVFEKFWAKGVDFKTGYGLTEAGPNTFWLPPEQVREKPGAVGYPLMHVDARIADEEDRPLPAGQVGELLIRGPHLFSGYWNNPEATNVAMRNDWLHTGDLAVRDEQGCFRIMGRSKEMIISGGENIYPAEVESTLHTHPDVIEAALIGIPDETWGEVGWAVVVPRSGSALDRDALITFCQDQLARYKIPKRFIFADSLPKTGANKVDKRKLIELYQE